MGHEFLRQEFDVTPMVAWQLDPFGHSSGLADLFAEIGFDAMFFARMNSEEMRDRRLERDLEFIWRPNFYGTKEEERGRKELFAHLLYDHYNPPIFIKSKYLTGSTPTPFD